MKPNKKNNWFNMNMMIMVLFSILLIFSSIKGVKANFVCGEVKDSIENVSASWYNINIFYTSLPTNILNCEISPAGNKYCCDTEAIPGKTWKIGDIISAEIYNNLSGYVAGPVSLTSTGEGYDIFPEMQLEKVINVYSPISRLILSNSSNILLNASFKQPYNHIELDNNGNKSLLCDNCESNSDNITFNYGMNNVRIIASSGNRSFNENLNFAIINDYSFNREFDCNGCNKNKVKANKVINTKIKLNLSHEVSGFMLKEYVPLDWEILNTTGGEVTSFSETHNMITWNVSGKDIELSYNVRSPDIFILPVSYTFKNELENLDINEQNVSVLKLIPFFIINEKSNFVKMSFMMFSKISTDKPLVFKQDDSISKIVIFPKKTLYNVWFSIARTETDKNIENLIYSFSLYNNIRPENIEKIYMELSVDKETISKNNYKNISLLLIGENVSIGQKISYLSEDNKSIYYSATTEPGKRFAVVGVK